jgi:hypothetical protein
MLFCFTANYTPKALEAMAKNPNTNRREAVEQLVTAVLERFDDQCFISGVADQFGARTGTRCLQGFS